MLTHNKEKPFNCEECGTRFFKKVHLKAHMRCHTGEKPFKCQECNTGYSHKVPLQIHVRTHTGEKPFGCEKCEKVFTCKSSVRKHISSSHTVEKKKHYCNECTAEFLSTYDLKVHMRSHTGENPYRCKMCELAFARKRQLDTHMYSHGVGLNLFNECRKGFSTRNNLNKHGKLKLNKPSVCRNNILQNDHEN